MGIAVGYAAVSLIRKNQKIAHPAALGRILRSNGTCPF
jgi:hypothetical protein